MEDKVYRHIEAYKERVIADEDWKIFEAMNVVLGKENFTEAQRLEYEEEVKKRTEAKIGCQEGRLAVWDEETE